MHDAYFDVGDDGHGLVEVVEGLQHDVGRLAVHCLQRVGELTHQVKGAISKVDPEVARVANMVEQVAQRVEAGFLVAKLVHVAHTQQGFKVGEGNCWGSGQYKRAGMRKGRCDSPRHPQWPSPRQVRKKAYFAGRAAVLIL